MKICGTCEREVDDRLDRCPGCGGELQRRSISDAINELMAKGEAESAASRSPCPKCGELISLRGPRTACPNCGAVIVRTAVSSSQLVLTRP